MSTKTLTMRWEEAPQRTEYGAGMMEALLPLGKDHTLRLYAEAEALHLVGPALLSELRPTNAPETLRLARVALEESEGEPIVCDWMDAALKVCRAVLDAPEPE